MTSATRVAELDVGQHGAGPAYRDLANDHRRQA